MLRLASPYPVRVIHPVAGGSKLDNTKICHLQGKIGDAKGTFSLGLKPHSVRQAQTVAAAFIHTQQDQAD